MPETKFTQHSTEVMLAAIRDGATISEAILRLPEEERMTERIVTRWIRLGNEELLLGRYSDYAIFATRIDEIRRARKIGAYNPNAADPDADHNAEPPRTKEALMHVLWRAAHAGNVTAANSLLRYMGGLTDPTEVAADESRAEDRERLSDLDRFVADRQQRNQAA